MSTTEIFGIKENGDVVKVGETEDAMRGAMFIWGQLSGEYNAGNVMDFSPLWELCDTPRMKDKDSLVLKTTFDNVVFMQEDIEEMLDAFADFDNKHPGSSLPEQAELIREKILNDDNMIGVCWNQISSIPNAWKVTSPQDNQLEPYNINEQSEHWVA